MIKVTLRTPLHMGPSPLPPGLNTAAASPPVFLLRLEMETHLCVVAGGSSWVLEMSGCHSRIFIEGAG